jgi:hypothetical protein
MMLFCTCGACLPLSLLTNQLLCKFADHTAVQRLVHACSCSSQVYPSVSLLAHMFVCLRFVCKVLVRHHLGPLTILVPITKQRTGRTFSLQVNQVPDSRI